MKLVVRSDSSNQEEHQKFQLKGITVEGIFFPGRFWVLSRAH
jgi:hypothetical protein